MKNSPRLPFAAFIAHLQRLGFTIGVEHYLRLYALLDGMGEHHPRQLKTLLCPLFATGKEQQQQFYAAFDSFFQHWYRAEEKAQTEQKAEQKAIAKTVRAFRRKAWFALSFSLFILLAVGFWTSYEPVLLNQIQQQAIQTQKNAIAQFKAQNAAPSPIAESKTDLPKQTSRRPPQILTIEKPGTPPQTWYEKHWNTLRRGIIGLPILLWLLWEARAWQRRRLAVVRRQGKKPPVSWPLKITPPQPNFLRSEGFYRLARILHQRLPGEQMRLDIPATVQRSIERLGYAELCYRPVQQVPEYLVLIDLPYGRDHHAHFSEVLFSALGEEDLHVHRFFYHRNPRILFAEADSERVFVQDLQARYGACRLLLVGDGEALLNPRSGHTEDWVELFQTWSQRAVLTPTKPADWGAREVQLAHEFTVLPASLNGLNSILTYFEEQRGESLRERKQKDTRDSLPDLPEEGEVTAEEIESLKLWLNKPDESTSNNNHDDGMFRWLCACAVYPELHWDLTLYLAGLDCLPNDLLNEDKLLRLLRLPWFRDGHMPDNWRWALLRELDNNTAACVRQALIEVLEQHPPPKNSVAWDNYHLNLAVQRWLFFRLRKKKSPSSKEVATGWWQKFRAWRTTRRELKQAIAAQPATQDYALLRLLEGTPSPLALLLPQRLRKLFYRNGVPLLGMRSGIRIAIIALLSGILVWAIPHYTSPVTPLTETWEIANQALNTLPAGTVFRDELQDRSNGPDMVVIKGGSFNMGSENGDSDEKPIHEVTLSDFYIGRYEVTVGEFKRFVEAENYQPQGAGCDWRNPGFAQTDKHPVVCVSWDEAQAYAEWLSRRTGYQYRLPTEAEWEYAARAGTATPYWWGEDVGTHNANCDGCGSQWDNKQTAPVGSFKANPFGLYDTAGNAWEWVQDWYGKYPADAQTDPTGPQDGSNRVDRGGAWYSDPRNVRSAYRDRSDPGGRGSDLGFRLARTDARPFYTSSPEQQQYPSFSDTLKDPKAIAPEMVVLPGDTFQMGSPDSEEGRDSDEGPLHDVTLSEFAIARYEVMFEEYDVFCEATGRDKPSDEGWGRGKRPVINVSWEDAQAYAEWLSEQSDANYRLPTEAEWEYAARGETKTAYWWGDKASHEYANYGKDECCDGLAEGKDKWINTAPVGSFEANPFGLYDTAGNVYEWVQDWFGDYPADAQTNPTGPEKGSSRVLRGGSWLFPAQFVRSASRNWLAPGNRDFNFGFRLARTGPWPFNTSELKEPTMVAFSQEVFFKMGSDKGEDDEKPVHDVTLSPFEIGAYEVTVGEFRRFVEAEDYQGEKPTDEWRCKGFMQPDFEQEDNHPVACITWNDAKAYITWLNAETGKEYRLPTEAEWEYAARGGTQTEYWWGNDIGQNNANCNSQCGDTFDNTSPVGSFKPNQFGLYDTVGNVWEWVEDWYGDYPKDAQTNPTGPEKSSHRVDRGGSWRLSAQVVRSANRGRNVAGGRHDYLGFRLARTVP